LFFLKVSLAIGLSSREEDEEAAEVDLAEVLLFALAELEAEVLPLFTFLLSYESK
jgi:hypothetical protein